MHISLDGSPLRQPKTGVGHYTFELACALARIAPQHEFELVSPYSFAGQTGNTPTQELPSNLALVRENVNAINRHWWSFGLPRYLKRHPRQIFHGTNYEVPLWGKCPAVLTIHDLSLLLHSETHLTRSVRRARRLLPLMVRAAKMIVTPTESVRQEVIEHLRVAPEKIVAVAEAPRRVFRPLSSEQTIDTRRRLCVEDDFLLCVGTIEPRKNLLTLVRAFDRVVNDAPPDRALQLVVAGKNGWLTDELFAQIKASAAASRVRLTGYISDNDLCALYSSCRAFVYPSLYEGFGLPPLEAMACGAPVMASRISSLAEVLGDAAHYFAPHDTDALAHEIVALLGSESEMCRLSTLGKQRAAKFTWERTAHAMLDVYDEAMSRKQSNRNLRVN